MSGDFDPRLADWLRQEAPVAIDGRVVDRIVAETRAASQRPRRVLRFDTLAAPALAITAVAAVVLAVVLAFPFRSPSVGPAATPGPSDAMPSPASSAPTTSATASPVPLEAWSSAPMPNPMEAYRGGIPEDAVRGGPGFVAVGGSSPCCADVSFDDEGWTAAIWTSTDGTNWALVPDLGSFGKAGLSAIDVDPGGRMLSVGYNVVPPEPSDQAPFGRQGTAWTSTNGIDWTAVHPPPGQYEDVIWAGDRWVIGGSMDGRPAVFTSRDLGDWSTQALDGYGHVAALSASADGRILAIGCADADEGGLHCPPVTWSSVDGHMDRIEIDASALYASVSWDDGFVVTGMTAEEVPRGMSWVLNEDDRWARSARPDGIGNAIAIVADGNRLIAGGSSDKVFESFDGLRWTPFAEPQLPDGAVEKFLRVLLPTDQGILALGEAFVTGAAPYVWIGER